MSHQKYTDYISPKIVKFVTFGSNLKPASIKDKLLVSN